jgi:hypothetical protein
MVTGEEIAQRTLEARNTMANWKLRVLHPKCGSDFLINLCKQLCRIIKAVQNTFWYHPLTRGCILNKHSEGVIKEDNIVGNMQLKKDKCDKKFIFFRSTSSTNENLLPFSFPAAFWATEQSRHLEMKNEKSDSNSIFSHCII